MKEINGVSRTLENVLYLQEGPGPESVSQQVSESVYGQLWTSSLDIPEAALLVTSLVSVHLVMSESMD